MGLCTAVYRAKSAVEALKWAHMAVPLVFLFYIVMRSVDRIFSTRMSKILKNPSYNVVFSDVIFPVGLFITQAILTSCYVLYMRFFIKDKRFGIGFFSPWSALASSKGAFPQHLLFLFIVGDELNAIL